MTTSRFRLPFRNILAPFAAAGLLLAGCTDPDEPRRAEDTAEEPAAPDQAPAPPSLDEAFALAFGGPAPVSKRSAQNMLSFRPGRLVELDDGLALVSLGEMEDACHGCSGSIAIHYLEHGEDGWSVAGEWLDAGGGSTWGAAASRWEVLDGYLSRPVVFSEGGGTFQGYTCASGQLLALEPEGPRIVATFPLAYSNEGTIERGTAIEGELGAAVESESFEVSYSGTRDGAPVGFTETWRWDGRAYELASAPHDLEGC